jgi:hypothetical protein
MSWDLTEKDMKAISRQYEKEKKERRLKIKRDVKLAYDTGTKVPYDIGTLIEAGIGQNRIIKVVRRK